HTSSKRDWSSDVCSSDLDVLRDELQLFQAAVGPLRLFVEIVFGRSAGLRLGHALIRARELLDLLARAPDIAPQHVDQSVELRFEIGRASCRQRVRSWGRD